MSLSSADPHDGMECPTCGSESGCRHLLLYLDLSSRYALGGAMADAFNRRMRELDPDHEDDNPTFDELVDAVEGLSYYDAALPSDLVPSSDQTYRAFYASPEDEVDALVDEFLSLTTA